MKTRYIITVCLVFAMIGNISAQQKSQIGINYKMGFPTGNFKEYLDEPSFAGFDFRVLFETKENLYLGFRAGAQNYYAFTERKTYSYDNGYDNVSATRTANTLMYPLMFQIQYDYPLSEKVLAYGGLGIGMNFIQNGWYYGVEMMDWVNNTAFAFAPELGIKVALDKYNTAFLTAGVNWDFSVYDQMDIKNISTINPFVGFTFRY